MSFFLFFTSIQKLFPFLSFLRFLFRSGSVVKCERKTAYAALFYTNLNEWKIIWKLQIKKKQYHYILNLCRQLDNLYFTEKEWLCNKLWTSNNLFKMFSSSLLLQYNNLVIRTFLEPANKIFCFIVQNFK